MFSFSPVAFWGWTQWKVELRYQEPPLGVVLLWKEGEEQGGYKPLPHTFKETSSNVTLCMACWRLWVPGCGVSGQDEGDVRLFCEASAHHFVQCFIPSREKHPHHLLYIASYVMMHGVVSTRFNTVILKLNQPIFYPGFPSISSVHALRTVKQRRY